MLFHPARLRCLGTALLLGLAACGGPAVAPPPIPEPPRAVLPSPLPLRMVTEAAPTLADAPRRVGTGEAAAMGAAATVLGTLGGAIYFGGSCLAGTMGADAGLLALLVCAPVGAVVGGVAGGAAGSQFGKGRGQIVGAVVGAVGGAIAGHQVERHVVRKQTQYEIAVRLEDGTTRTIVQDTAPAWREGDRVRLNGNELRAAS